MLFSIIVLLVPGVFLAAGDENGVIIESRSPVLSTGLLSGRGRSLARDCIKNFA